MKQRDARMLSRYPGPNAAQHPAPGAGCSKVGADRAGQGRDPERGRAGAGRGGAGRGAGGALGRTAPGDFEPRGRGSRWAWRAGSGTGCCWRTPSSWCWCAGRESRTCGGTALPGWACCGPPAWWWGCECGNGAGTGSAGLGGRQLRARGEGIPQARPRVPGTSLEPHWENSPKEADRCGFPGRGHLIQVQAMAVWFELRGRVPCG